MPGRSRARREVIAAPSPQGATKVGDRWRECKLPKVHDDVLPLLTGAAAAQLMPPVLRRANHRGGVDRQP
jgi:hypothetical protein